MDEQTGRFFLFKDTQYKSKTDAVTLPEDGTIWRSPKALGSIVGLGTR